MNHGKITLAATALLLAVAPASAGAEGTLQFWEDSRGAPGATAEFPSGTALSADIDFDADSAEGGGLLYGATEIEIRPTGSVVFTGFTCELAGCTENQDYVFVPGNAGAGAKILVSDPDFRGKHGIYDLGTIVFDSPEDPGSIPLVTCNYIGMDFVERTCSPFVLVNLPEPGAIASLAAGAALLFGPLRRRRNQRRR